MPVTVDTFETRGQQRRPEATTVLCFATATTIRARPATTDSSQFLSPPPKRKNKNKTKAPKKSPPTERRGA